MPRKWLSSRLRRRRTSGDYRASMWSFDQEHMAELPPLQQPAAVCLLGEDEKRAAKESSGRCNSIGRKK